ncbi:hypothetical protein DSW55_10015, partial [Campylobacter coli]|nr:hypothetical protein [Campylobacter coli]
NIIYSKSTNYFYDIFEVDEVFINCVNQLLTNLNIKNILATSDNTYHIETDTDSDASNTKGGDTRFRSRYRREALYC